MFSIDSVPKTSYPDELVTHPLDFYPFLLYFVTGFAYVELFRIRPNIFAYTLVLSSLPIMLCQLHMMYGSVAVYDGHFLIAHFLKIMAYFTPFLGISYEYIHTYMKDKERELLMANSAKFAALGEMAGGIAHEVNNPLAIIHGYASMPKREGQISRNH